MKKVQGRVPVLRQKTKDTDHTIKDVPIYRKKIELNDVSFLFYKSNEGGKREKKLHLHYQISKKK